MQRVLVVDDEVLVGRSLGRWLSARGAEVLVINDPTRFEETVARFRPGVIISDYMMPARTGVEVLRAARQLVPEARRFLLSASLSEVGLAERASLAPCLFFDKPWDSTALAQALGLAEAGSP